MTTIRDTMESVESTRRSYAPKEYVVMPGDMPKEAYYVESGKVRQFQIRENGSEVVVNVYGPGAILSLAWIVGKLDNKFFFQAIEPTVLKIADASVVSDAFASDPVLSYETLSRLVRGFDGMYERLIVHGSNKSLQRVVVELDIEARRFGIKEGDEFLVKLTSSELAARTGMTREATSRALHVLDSAGVLVIEKGGYRVKIRDDISY
jgi:CRP/FNR family cyclic AMP-dependent transcriptional regulator